MFSEEHQRAKKAGLPPGTLKFTGKQGDRLPSVTIASYSPTHYEEKSGTHFSPDMEILHSPGAKWVNIEGLHDTQLIQEVATYFKLHPLTVEDILNIAQRPKIEEFEDYLFVILKVLDWQSKKTTFKVKQLSLILGKDFVLSFQEADTTRFDQIREKLHGTSQRLREQGTDYLTYRLIDAVVDEYFVVLESIGDRIEQVEDKIIISPTPENAKTIYRLKRQMLILRKAIWPMREAVSHMLHIENEIISTSTRIYLRDVYDHTMQAIDTLETFREMLSSMLDMYLSGLTNRMNEIMKTLTVITTIFIPITAVASFYGMNFVDLPGIHTPWAWLIVFISMAGVAILMLFYFRAKKWL
ncbi:MAG: magnesium/cobalt transporter CorA [Gammaproteobacteria bacterium]|nr:magnesium/cobalt transporter CorA [Gammaproteobacteria bacterium]